MLRISVTAGVISGVELRAFYAAECGYSFLLLPLLFVMAGGFCCCCCRGGQQSLGSETGHCFVTLQQKREWEGLLYTEGLGRQLTGAGNRPDAT